MKNKVIFLGSLFAILALGLVFIGCETEVPVVDHPDAEEVVIRVSRAGTGEAIEKDKNNNFLVAWNTVEDASYQVVFRPLGKTAYFSFNTVYGSDLRFDKYVLNTGKTDFVLDNTVSVWENLDECVWYIPSTEFGAARYFSGVSSAVSQVTGQFGLIVYPNRRDRNPVIVWDDVEYRIER